MYSGPSILSNDLNIPIFQSVVLSLSQTINLEADLDKNCKNYPDEKFDSFKHCDDDFLRKQVYRTNAR